MRYDRDSDSEQMLGAPASRDARQQTPATTELILLVFEQRHQLAVEIDVASQRTI